MVEKKLRTSGHLPRALIGLLTLELALLKTNMVSFRWPQDADSGIDLVSFVVSPDEAYPGTPLATSFVAGFQSKSTAQLFTKAIPKAKMKGLSPFVVKTMTEPKPQQESVGNHKAYWMTATMPVFIAAIDGNGLILVEDTGSFLQRHPKASKIEMKRPLEEVSADIRLRTIAHALAPWISAGLRRHLLGEGEDNSPDTTTVWALLANQLAFANAVTAYTWTEVNQYFALVNYLISDEGSRKELCASLVTQPNAGREPMGFYLLQHLIDMYLRYEEVMQTAPHIAPGETQLAMHQSVDVIHRVWREAEVCLGVNTPKLAGRLAQIHTSAEVRAALEDIEQGIGLKDVVLGLQATWRKAHPETCEGVPILEADDFQAVQNSAKTQS